VVQMDDNVVHWQLCGTAGKYVIRTCNYVVQPVNLEGLMGNHVVLLDNYLVQTCNYVVQ
jgi:hypothetical protein